MEASETISEYCERLDASFWAEPANAISNAAFLATAIGAWVLMRSLKTQDRPASLLILVTACIAFGSFLFHTVPNGATALADVGPITLFIHIYFFMAVARFLKQSRLVAALATVGFAVAAVGTVALLQPIFGATAGYMPALIAIFVVAVLARVHDEETSRGLIHAGAMFAVSLAFRMIDAPACGWFPIGTHFMWHVLNAVVLYMLLRVLLRAGLPLHHAARTPL